MAVVTGRLQLHQAEQSSAQQLAEHREFHCLFSQEQVMKKPASPRTPKHGRGLFGRAASPRKAQQQLRLGAAQVSCSVLYGTLL